ncbi:MAG: hypothetical protein ABSG67_09345 [Thermoguttaceae bacterium]|jgi:hypothetical protein
MKILYLWLMVIASVSLCYSQEAPNPEIALNSYEAYLKSIRNVSFSSLSKDRDAEKSDVFANILSEKLKIDFERKRMWRTTRSVIENPQTESDKVRATSLDETLITSRALLEISTLTDKTNADKATVSGFTGYLKIPADYWQKHLTLGCLSYPFGYIQDGRQYKYIPDMIRNGTKKVAFEKGDSTPLAVLACETEEYLFNIRLDPSKGWMPDRIEFTRKASSKADVRNDYCLYAVDHSSDHGGVWIADSYRCKVSSPAGRNKLPENIRMVNGAFILIDKNTKEPKPGVDYIEYPKSTLIAEVRLSDIDLSPLHDSDFHIQTKIPNGTRVYMQDVIGPVFIWQNGKILPLGDDAVKAWRDSRFLGGPSSYRFWLFIEGLVMGIPGIPGTQPMFWLFE